MKALQRNMQTFYYALRGADTQELDTNGDYTGSITKTYGTPVEMRANITPAKSSIEFEPYGIHEKYTRVILTDDMNCPIDKTSVLWIGVQTSQKHNYIVVGVVKALNSITIAIREADVG